MLGWANHIEHTRSTQRWYDSKRRLRCQYGMPGVDGAVRAGSKKALWPEGN